MVANLLIVLFPWLIRGLLQEDEVQAGNVALSAIPALVCLGGSRLQWMVREEEREHIGRHIFYASAFLLGAMAVHWEEADVNFVAYFASTGALLWWFAASHALENVRSPAWLYTHQGDTLVLPITLIAISTFVNDLDDSMFRFSRSVVFFVPVVVGWVVVMLIAYAGFATSKTTTLSAPGYDGIAHQGLLIAGCHLLLIEVKAPPIAYFLFAASGSLFAQVTYRSQSPPQLRARTGLGTVLTSLVAGLAAASVLVLRFEIVETYLIVAYASVTYTLSVRRVCGRRWIVPATLFSSLFSVLCLRLLHPIRPPLSSSRAYGLDAMVTLPAFAAAFAFVSFVSPAVHVPSPPDTYPPLHADRPQDAPSACSVTALSTCVQRMLRCKAIPCSTSHTLPALQKSTLSSFYDSVNPLCPWFLKGVWWMEGNVFPMDLICVHRVGTWNEDGTQALLHNADDVTYHNSFAGLVTYWMSRMTYTQITVVDRAWIRTDSWRTPLRLFAHTYWLLRVDDDTMLRLVYDTDGNVVWRYKMKRLCRSSPSSTTVHWNEFSKSGSMGQPSLLHLSRV